MSEDIKVTVCCITYNQEKYIEKALSSLVMQKTNFKYEILVHDDASTDRTPEIIKEFEKRYPELVRPIFQKENQYSKGISITREILHPLTRGKYVAACEGDDYWVDENKLQIQYDIMEENPDISMCVHKVQCVNEDGTLNEKIHPQKKYEVTGTGIINQEQYADLLLLKGGYPFHTSSFFRRKELMEGDMFNGLPNVLNGDRKILYSSLYAGSIYYIDKVMTHRRLFAIGSYNSRLLEKSQEEKWKIFLNDLWAEIVFDKISKGKFHKKVVESILKHFYPQFQRKDVAVIRKVFSKFDEELDYDWKYPLKMNVKYFLMKYFPNLIPLVVKKNKK